LSEAGSIRRAAIGIGPSLQKSNLCNIAVQPCVRAVADFGLETCAKHAVMN